MTQGTESHWSVKTWRDRVGREVGSGAREHMYAYGQFMFLYSKTITKLKKKKKKERKKKFITTDNEPRNIFISIM